MRQTRNRLSLLRRLARPLSAAVLVLSGSGAMADAANPARPVLLELFTSQGCSSCPPADALLRELGSSPDLLPLAFHVDYWDYLGWADPFASPAFTARQQHYAARRGFQSYTPQLVIDGQRAKVGSDRAGVESAIAVAKAAATGAPARIERRGSEVEISVGRAPQAGGDAAPVWLLSFDPLEITAIRSGENAGRSIAYANVVRSMRQVGDWKNQPLNLHERLRAEERGARLALIVQDDDGRVWAVASTPPAERN